MTSEYRVVTKHTRENLLAFIKFTYRINSPKTTFRLCLLAGGFFILAMFLKHEPGVMRGCVVAGMLLLLFTFTRHWIALYRLMKNDDIYKNQSEVEFTFHHSGIVVKSQEWVEDQEAEYKEISAIYKDKKNYYLFVREQEVFLLPMMDFKFGKAEEFYKFICGKTRKPMYMTTMTLKERLGNLNSARKKAEQMHDEKVAEKKRKKQLGK